MYIIIVSDIVREPFHVLNGPRNATIIAKVVVGWMIPPIDMRQFMVILAIIRIQPLEEMVIGYDDLDPESEQGFRVVVLASQQQDAALSGVSWRQKQGPKHTVPVHYPLGQMFRGNNNVAFVPLMALQDLRKFLDRILRDKMFHQKHRHVRIIVGSADTFDITQHATN